MANAQNERIATHLRALVERVEKAPHEYTAVFSVCGGEPRFIDRGGRQIPDGFGPVGHTLILGDKDFVETHVVVERNKN